MMKKMFNVTIGGYYLVSIVIGILLMISVSMYSIAVWDDAFNRLCAAYPESWNLDSETSEVFQARSDVMLNIWTCLPFHRLGNAMYVGGGGNYATLVATVTMMLVLFLAVAVIEGRGAKVWRTKIFQGLGIGGMLLCVAVALEYALTVARFGGLPYLVFVPLIGVALFLLVLKRLKQNNASEATRRREPTSEEADVAR